MNLALPRLASKAAATNGTVGAADTSIELDTDYWTVDAAYYPMQVIVGGELVTVTAATLSGTVTLTGCTRSVNGVIREHPAGTTVEVANPIRLGLGRPSYQIDPIPDIGGGGGPLPSVPTTDLVVWIDTAGSSGAANLAPGSVYTSRLGSTTSADSNDPSVVVQAGNPVWQGDATDDYIQTDYVPSVTATTGQLTIIIVGVYSATDTTTAFPRWASTESALNDGVALNGGPAATEEIRGALGGATTTPFDTLDNGDGLDLTDGEPFLAAVVVDAGTVSVYSPQLGLSAGASTTGAGTITHAALRFLRPADDTTVGRRAGSGIRAALVYEDALDQTTLDSIADAYGFVAETTLIAFREGLRLATAGQPPHVLEALGYTATDTIARSALDGILDDWVTGTGGTTRNVTSSGEWTTACAAAVPGDLIRVTSGFDAAINARGDLYGLSGATFTTSPDGGDEGLPIIVTCADGVYVDDNNTSSNDGVLDIQNCRHVWAVGFNVRDGQFGIRCMNWGGTENNPAYVAYCDIDNIGDAGMLGAGWFGTIAGSGGTPPAGDGNEWGFSEHFVFESNTIDGVGVRTGGHPGEGIYLGNGSPGWIARAQHFWVRGNEITDWTSDGIDLKPGCHNGLISDNIIHTGHAVSGAPMSLLYVAAAIGNRPAWYDIDPEIYVEGNRVYDNDITNTDASSVHIMGYIGLSGIRIANNVMWAHPQTGTHATWRVRIETGTDDTTALAQFRSDPVWLINNTCWGDDSFENAGYGAGGGFPVAMPSSVTSSWTLLNNIVDNASPATGEVDASASDFAGTVPAIGAAGSADDGGGPGSAFDLAGGSALVGTGASIPVTLAISRDILNRPISASPSPGAFQP